MTKLRSGKRQKWESVAQITEAWKEEKARDLLALIEELHPGFSACVDKINIASPLTIRDYYGSKEGSMFGLVKTIRI